MKQKRQTSDTKHVLDDYIWGRYVWFVFLPRKKKFVHRHGSENAIIASHWLHCFLLAM